METPLPRRRRSPATLLTWLTVVVVLAIVVVLLVVKASTGNLGSSPPTPPQITPAPSDLVGQVTGIPASVFNQIGVTSPAVPITPPVAAPSGVSPLERDGKPVVFFYGAEFCGYCAAERWALIASLSRFGAFANLGLIRSTGTQYPAGIESFTFRNTTYRSKYLVLETIERRSDYNPTGAEFTSLQKPSASETRLLTTFHVVGYPFIDVANRYVTDGPSYSPSFLSGLTWSEIGSYLDEPQQPVAEAVVALSNDYSAAVCASTGGHPGSVCHSRGVLSAAHAMGISTAS